MGLRGKISKRFKSSLRGIRKSLKGFKKGLISPLNYSNLEFSMKRYRYLQELDLLLKYQLFYLIKILVKLKKSILSDIIIFSNLYKKSFRKNKFFNLIMVLIKGDRYGKIIERFK